MSSGGLIYGFFPVSFVAPQSVIALGANQGKSILYAVNTLDGTKQWEWSDWLITTTYVSPYFPYIKDGYMVMNTKSDLYAIDIKRGKTIWRQQQLRCPLFFGQVA
jgi:outer membrane protein assembly factor BamB